METEELFGDVNPSNVLADIESESITDTSQYAKAFNDAKIDKLREDIEGLKQDRMQRKMFAVMIFIFTCIYVFLIIVIVVLCGSNILQISDAVQITMLTTTLAEVIGVLTFVAKYLFHT